jgi:hypothetical protein
VSEETAAEGMRMEGVKRSEPDTDPMKAVPMFAMNFALSLNSNSEFIRIVCAFPFLPLSRLLSLTQ